MNERKKHDISLVMPCYNEEVTITKTVPDLINAFTGENIHLELILVNNGSTDKTEEVIDNLKNQYRLIRKVNVYVNEGYGNGILQGLKECNGKYVGFMCSDGQVAAEDVLDLYKMVTQKRGHLIAKVRRRFRPDGTDRKIISICYNIFINILFGNLYSIDINGNPKIFSCDLLEILSLSSQNWFLDPELMIKAKKLKLPILEVDVRGRHRAAGKSHVRLSTCFEFIKCLCQYRMGTPLKKWSEKVQDKIISDDNNVVMDKGNEI